MRRASLASLVLAATLGLALLGGAARAEALPWGFGKGLGYCAEYGSHASAYSFEDVYACASTESAGPTPFDENKDESFQCVELSARFLWAVYAVWAGPDTGIADGAELVGVVHHRYPRFAIGAPGPGSVPVAGDVISLGPGGGVDRRFGHTAIVVSDDQRHGHFRILSQNFPPGQAGKAILYVDLQGRHNGRVRANGIWTAASWLELHPQPKPKPKPKPPRRRR